jgi:hypothetical protein
MPEIGTSGLMSGDGKRGDGQRPQATAPILDSTRGPRFGPLAVLGLQQPSAYYVALSIRYSSGAEFESV